MCGEAAQMGQTSEFVSSNVTYTPTVNKTGVLQKKPKVLLWIKPGNLNPSSMRWERISFKIWQGS